MIPIYYFTVVKIITSTSIINELNFTSVQFYKNKLQIKQNKLNFVYCIEARNRSEVGIHPLDCWILSVTGLSIQ